MISCILLVGAPFLFIDNEGTRSDSLVKASAIESVTGYLDSQTISLVKLAGSDKSSTFGAPVNDVLEALKTCPRAR